MLRCCDGSPEEKQEKSRYKLPSHGDLLTSDLSELFIDGV